MPLDMAAGWDGAVALGRAASGGVPVRIERVDMVPSPLGRLRLSRSPQVFALFEDAAVRRVKCPTNDAIAEMLGIANPDKFIRELKMTGLISAKFFCGSLFRQVTILAGPNAGRATASLDECPDFLAHWHKPHLHTVTKRTKRCRVPARDLRSHGRPTCAWCGGDRDADYVADTRSCCSVECTRLWIRHGYATQAQVEQRRNRPAGPRGCTSVEQWLAAGGTIYRETSRCEVVRV